MVFPDLLSANLTVKAIMYTADCQFGGVLRGTTAPVVFMSRADTTPDAAQLPGPDPRSPGSSPQVAARGNLTAPPFPLEYNY